MVSSLVLFSKHAVLARSKCGTVRCFLREPGKLFSAHGFWAQLLHQDENQSHPRSTVLLCSRGWIITPMMFCFPEWASFWQVGYLSFLNIPMLKCPVKNAVAKRRRNFHHDNEKGETTSISITICPSKKLSWRSEAWAVNPQFFHGTHWKSNCRWSLSCPIGSPWWASRMPRSSVPTQKDLPSIMGPDSLNLMLWLMC